MGDIVLKLYSHLFLPAGVPIQICRSEMYPTQCLGEGEGIYTCNVHSILMNPFPPECHQLVIVRYKYPKAVMHSLRFGS